MRQPVLPAAGVTVDATAVARALLDIAFVLVLFSTVATLVCDAMGRNAADVRLAQVFYLDGERNLPTAYSTFLLLFAAALLTLITHIERQGGHPVLYWAVLAAGFTLMAVDEAWAFHERLTLALRVALGNHDLGIFYNAWVVPALGLLGVLLLFFLRFLIHLPPGTRGRFIVSGLVYVGGAVGIELIEGRYAEAHGYRNLTAAAISTIQEAMEMVGAILFIRALLIHLSEQVESVGIHFVGTPDGRGITASVSHSEMRGVTKGIGRRWGSSAADGSGRRVKSPGAA